MALTKVLIFQYTIMRVRLKEKAKAQPDQAYKDIVLKQLSEICIDTPWTESRQRQERTKHDTFQV